MSQVDRPHIHNYFLNSIVNLFIVDIWQYKKWLHFVFLLSLIITSEVFVDYSGFSICKIMLSANKYIFTASFPIWIPVISFPYLTAVIRIFNIILTTSFESGNPCLVADLGEIFHSSPIKFDVHCRFYVAVLNQVEEVIFSSQLLEFYIMKGYAIWSNICSESIEVNM